MVQYCCTYQTPLSIGHEVAEVAASLVLQRQVQLRIEDITQESDDPTRYNYIEHGSAKATKIELSCLNEIPLQMLPMGMWGPENMKIKKFRWGLFEFYIFLS